MSILVDRLVKTYDEHAVVNQVSFEVADGECFVLLGPSGSGKSTVLRIVAGLAPADAGRVVLHGRDVTDLPPQKRDVGMVFQHYALFGHMTVARNVEFPLRIRGEAAAARQRRRNELLELVGLVGLHDRYPHQLSGGQQQRVALARALAHRPEVLLLDEPFGALDARIRQDLRRTLKRIQREVHVTTIFVTHDQEEAFELADRLAVMNFGRILEVGPPDELYMRPRTEFVAAFLGKANLLVGECAAEGVRLGHVLFPLGSRPADLEETKRVQILFRPEDVAVKLTRDALDGPSFGEGIVEEVDFSASTERLRVRIPRIPGVRPISPPVPFGADYIILESTRSQHVARRYPLRAGDRAWVGVRHVHALSHRGFNFLIVDDGTPAGRSALEYGGLLARLSHARVTLCSLDSGGAGSEARIQAARDILGSGLAGLEVRGGVDAAAESIVHESERGFHDLIIVARPTRGSAPPLQELMRSGEHHVLSLPGAARAPRSVLLCTAAGEPSKDDILFAGRLVRHTGAMVTVITAMPEVSADASRQVERFHAASLRTLALFGIQARSVIEEGPAAVVIGEEIRRRGYDLLVVGSPLTPPGETCAFGSVVRELLDHPLPVLIVRSGRRPA